MTHSSQNSETLPGASQASQSLSPSLTFIVQPYFPDQKLGIGHLPEELPDPLRNCGGDPGSS